MLKSIAAASLMLSVMIVLGGCQDTAESFREDELECLEDMLEVLKGITDEDSADDAESDIEDVKEDMKALTERKKEWREAMEEKYEDREEAVRKDLSKEMRRLSDEKWAKKVLKLLRERVD